jgi:hypothetical protein
LLSVTALAFLAGLILPVALRAMQHEGEKAVPPNMEEMMKKWEESAAPGPAHKVLEDAVGTWTTSVKMWMQGPDAPPMESQGTAEIRWVLDGRFLMEETKGEMMGKTFEGIGFTGYDNFKQVYVNTWMDNSSTALYSSTGVYDPATKTLTSTGLMDEPMTGEKNKTVRYILHMVDKDKMVTEIMDTVMGKEFKAVEITYTRRS